MTQVQKSQSKSGLRALRAGEVLFCDGDKANSLYIIQKGQLRLFKPKGKGFIEIAVLRSGEVIGEMAYFDDDGGGKRSCSASAMVSSDVIEISFSAFSKTMSGLNPWFKTIINTLAKRLRATNARVKQLESNSATVNYGSGKHSGYEFFKTADIIKILGTLYLVFKAHGEESEAGPSLHKKTLNLYARDIYGIIESKLDEMLLVLEDLKVLSLSKDPDGMAKVLTLKKLLLVKSLFIFYNTEKHLAEDKKLKISEKCQIFLEGIHKKVDQAKVDNTKMSLIPVQDLLNFWKERKIGIKIDDLDEARLHGIVGEVIVDDNSGLAVEVQVKKLLKLLPHIQFMNRIQKANDQKAG